MIGRDTRLLKAVRAPGQYDLVCGFYDGRVYVAANLWRNPSWAKSVVLSKRTGGHLATLKIEDWANFQSNKNRPGNTGEIDQGWRNRAGWDDLPDMTGSPIIEIE